jgi:hypothetical protein
MIISDDFSVYRPELYLDARFDVLDGHAVQPALGALNMAPLVLGYPTFTLDIDQTVDNDEVLEESVNTPWIVNVALNGFGPSFNPHDGTGLTGNAGVFIRRGGVGFGEIPVPDDIIEITVADPFTDVFNETHSVPGGTLPLRMRVLFSAGLMLVTDRDDDSDVWRVALPDVGSYYAAITAVQVSHDNSIVLNRVALDAMRYEGDCRITEQGADLWTFSPCTSPVLTPWPYPTPSMAVSAGPPAAVRVAR